MKLAPQGELRILGNGLGAEIGAAVHNSPLWAIDFYGEFAFYDRPWDLGLRFGRGAFDFAFPCASALYNLPADAPMWKRRALLVGGGIEIAPS